MTSLTLRDYQEECLLAHWTYLRDHPKGGNPLFVLPTGAGKSLVIAEFLRACVTRWPQTRFLVATHVRELVRQDYEAFQRQWSGPLSPAGVYSAGMRRRDADASVIFASVQTACRAPEKLGRFDAMLVDEAHLVPKRGMGRYRKLITDLRERNERMRVFGYTATHYRLDGGYLHKGGGAMFSDVAYELSIERLIEEGHLVRPRARLPRNTIKTAGVKTVSGDFSQKELESTAMDEGALSAAVTETVETGRAAGRSAWLVFAVTVSHATAIRDKMRELGVDAELVLGSTPKEERDTLTARFKAGKLTCLVSCGVLTTGFDAPCADMLAVMRPTQSAALYVQMLGRGMRPFPGKADCLVLDFGENVARHGPINKVRPHSESAGDPEDRERVITCPSCAEIHDPDRIRECFDCRRRWCPACGFLWEPRPLEKDIQRHAAVSSASDPFSSEENAPVEMAVRSWKLHRHVKRIAGAVPCVCVTYATDVRKVTEWLFPEHSKQFLRIKSWDWWRAHDGRRPMPSNAAEFLRRVRELTMPERIRVRKENKFDKVVAFDMPQEAKPC